jgi:hypothetical protein
MRQLAIAIGVAVIGCGCTGKATLRLDPDMFPVRPITDCAVDGRESSETPIKLDPALETAVLSGPPDLRTNIQEPYCWYQLPGDTLMLRDSRRLEYYFRQDGSKWLIHRIDVPPVGHES